MKSLALCAILAAPAASAWEVEVGPICVLTHETGTASVRLTHDPRKPEYSLTITRQGPWPAGQEFQMVFGGLGGFTIGTDRHVLTDEGRTLSVADSGFGNVLNGLAAGGEALARSGNVTEVLPVDGAAEAVEIFRLCRPIAGV